RTLSVVRASCSVSAGGAPGDEAPALKYSNSKSKRAGLIGADVAARTGGAASNAAHSKDVATALVHAPIRCVLFPLPACRSVMGRLSSCPGCLRRRQRRPHVPG